MKNKIPTWLEIYVIFVLVIGISVLGTKIHFQNIKIEQLQTQIGFGSDVNIKMLCARTMISQQALYETLQVLPYDYNIVEVMEQKYGLNMVKIYNESIGALASCNKYVEELTKKYEVKPKCNRLGIVINASLQLVRPDLDISEEYCK